MQPSNTNHWTADPQYIDLFNYLNEKAKNVKSPMNIRSLARGFKEKSGAAQSVDCLVRRIEALRTWIQSSEHIDENTKVKLLFALSAGVYVNFLEELKWNALVEVDDEKRITYYKSNDGSLELRGDHSQSAKEMLPSNSNHFTADPGYINLLNYIIERAENVESPLNIQTLARKFKEKSGAAERVSCLSDRIRFVRTKIQSFDHIDTNTKVRMMFALGASVNADFLEKLKEGALVEVDDKQRIAYYKANDGSFELIGDHSLSAKNKTTKLESKQSTRSWIIDYFENKNNSDAVPENEAEKGMWNFIELITEKCENINSPLSIRQLTKDFNNHFGSSRSFAGLSKRTKKYCEEIQKAEFLDTPSKVKQLFGLGATLDSDCLKKLREDAVVEVDNLNRITKYTANNGSLTLCGNHSRSAKTKLALIERNEKRNPAMNSCASEGDYDKESEKEIDHPEDDSEEFDSDNDNKHLDYTEDPVEQLNKEISIGFNLDFDLSTERSHRAEEVKTRKFVEEKNNPEITENAVIKTKSGRMSKKRHLDSNFSYDLANSSDSGALMSSSSSYSKPAKHFHPLTERSHVSKVIEMREDDGRKRKKGNNYTLGSISSNPVGSSSNDSMRWNLLDDYDRNYSIDDQVKLEPFRGEIQEDLDEFDEDIQYIPKPPQSHDEHNQIEEAPIKVEPDEPKTVEYPQEDVKPEIAQVHDEYKEPIEIPIKEEQEEHVEVKPETSHNSIIKFFKAMHSLTVCLDTPSLSWIQSKIQQKIQKLGESDEVILNNEISLTIDLLISRMTNHSVVNLSDDVESVNFSNLLCYLKASILNSKMSGVEGLMKIISELIEESQNKRIPMVNVANALRATLDIDGF